mgnify:FL=1
MIKVEIVYNPYNYTSSILINENEIPDNSSLIQYTDKPFKEWKDIIFKTIYKELNDKFFFVITSREYEIEILKYIAQNFEKCSGFESHLISMDKNFPLNKRMKSLNSLIKQQSLKLPKNIIYTDFLFDFGNNKDFSYIIDNIGVENSFCKVIPNIITSENLCFSGNDTEKFLFVISDKKSISPKKYEGYEQVFVITYDENLNESFFYYENDNCLAYCTNDILKKVIECLIFMPLNNAFVKALNYLFGKDIYINENFRNLTLIKDIPVITGIPDKLECGKSCDISINKNNIKYPELRFEYRNANIVRCDLFRVTGINKGSTIIYAYEKGERHPFLKKSIEVYETNKIKNFEFSENVIIMGQGDTRKLKVQYLPENADNTDKIFWQSTDNSIVSVKSNEGKNQTYLKAENIGECCIQCCAENVTAQISVEVKPYLEDIIIEETKIKLIDGDKYPLNIKLYPSNVINPEYKIFSNCPLVVKVVGNILTTVSPGHASIVIMSESNENIRKEIDVTVIKKSFFSRLKK